MNMDTIETAERELASHLLWVGRAVDATGAQQKLLFTVEEEQAVEDRLNDAVDALRTALKRADEEILEVGDPQAAASAKQHLATARAKLQTHVVHVRKILVAYRQKAKGERLNKARDSLMQKSGASGDQKSMNKNGSAVDFTATLMRTRRVMAEEVERVGSVSRVLDDGRVSLKSSHQEFDSVNVELAKVRKNLKALQWQARQDRMWIAAGIALLASTVLYIMHQRTGLLLI